MEIESREEPGIGAFNPPPQPATPPPAPQPEGFRFTGSGGEYFKIWIVNLLLTIVTFGIYSAWAKVRRLQYFYRHTEVAGSTFDYHGNPVSILKGRIVALVLFAAYNFAGKISFSAAVITFLILAVVLPWLLRNSFRFRLRYSSYRGLRFSFKGTLAESYFVFLPIAVIGLITLIGTGYVFDWQLPQRGQQPDTEKAPLFAAFMGVIVLVYFAVWPWLHHRIKRFQHGNAWFGQTAFSFTARVSSFYAIYGVALLLFIAAIAVAALAAVVAGMVAGLGKASVLLMLPLYIVVLGIAGAYYTTRIVNLVWNHTQLGAHRFESSLRLGPLFGIQALNILLIVLTFGLYMPWAAVRLARYRAENLTLHPAGPLEGFLADNAQGVNAIGEETMEMFDFDIGL